MHKYPGHYKAIAWEGESLQALNHPYLYNVLGLQVNKYPFVSFDAGGVLELFDYNAHPQSIVWEATATALAARLQEVMEAGQMQTCAIELLSSRRACQNACPAGFSGCSKGTTFMPLTVVSCLATFLSAIVCT